MSKKISYLKAYLSHSDMCHCMPKGCIYDHNSYSSHHAAFILLTRSVIYSNRMSCFLLIILTLLPGKWAHHRFKWFWEGLLGQAKLQHYSSQFSWGQIIFGHIYLMCLPQFSALNLFCHTGCSNCMNCEYCICAGCCTVCLDFGGKLKNVCVCGDGGAEC